MMLGQRRVRSMRRSMWVGAVLAASLISVATVSAQGPKSIAKIADSLSLVPRDAAFYSSSLHLKEQWDLLVGSKAWAELTALPVVQTGMFLAEAQFANPDSPLGKAKGFLDQPENQQLADLLIDMGSQEIFIFGGKDTLKSLELLVQLNAANRMGPLAGLLEETDPQKARVNLMLETLMENRESLVAPDMVIGFRITNKQVAEDQLARLEKRLEELLQEESPQWSERLRREAVDGRRYLTFTFDGGMLPIDEIEEEDLKRAADELEIELKQVKQLLREVKKLTLKIAIGVREDYLVVSLGKDSQPLAQLGQGPPLAQHPKLKKLATHAKQRIVGLSYSSSELIRAATTTGEDVQALGDVAAELLADAELNDDVKRRIEKDARELADELAQTMGRIDASVQCTFLTGRGYETYRYNWSQARGMSSAQPITLLQHLGGSPLAVFAGRCQPQPGSLDRTAHWLKKFFGYFEEIALPEMDPDDRQTYQEAKKKYQPLLKRLYDVTAQKLAPALSDCQSGFVLEAEMTSEQWIEALPRTAVGLPMFEPAILVGLSDSQQFIEALADYREIINEGIEIAAELSEGEIDKDLEIPRPESEYTDAGSFYSYAFPDDWGVDSQAALSLGVGDDVAVFGISPAQAKRLIVEKPLELTGPIAERAGKPNWGVAYIDFAGLMETAQPWIDFGVRMGLSGGADGVGPLGDPANDSPQITQVLGQVHAGLKIARCIRSASAVTYRDGDVTVTRSELYIEDLK